MPDSALDGVRVLDLSNLLAGPMATMHMADFGADVIKVEHPRRGDEMRRWGYSRDGVGLMFKVLNRNKRMITLDLHTEQGAELARSLARHCDVVVESFRPGTLERWGLGYEKLSEHNRGLVMLHISGFGRTGPRSPRPGFGTVAEAFSGAAYINGYPDRPPMLPPFGLGDTSSAIFGAYAVMVALRHRDRTGAGQEVDLGLYEGLFAMLGSLVVDHDQLGVVQERMGSNQPFVAPRSTYEAADGRWLAIAGSTQATFERMCRALGLDDMLDDPRFADNAKRVANNAALNERIGAAVREHTREEALALLDEAGAPASPVHDVAQIFEDPHFAARGNIATVGDDELGDIRMQNVAARLSLTPGRIAHAGPPKGRHNQEVYRDLLGLDAAALRELEAAEVI